MRQDLLQFAVRLSRSSSSRSAFAPRIGWGTFGGRFGFWTSLVLILLIFNRIRLEERLLAEHFGQAYEAYKARPKRLVPFVF
jgi:protein-S-isoprenylcysteine O-methyltransferase Ste14